MQSTILLPKHLYDNDLSWLVRLLGEHNASQEIYLDWERANFFIPGAVVVLLAKTHGWLGLGKKVYFTNHLNSSAFRYLQRMNFFDLCEIRIPEDFIRRPADGRFVPIIRVGRGGEFDTGPLSTRVAECIAPGAKDLIEPEKTGLFDCIEYAVSELTANVVQHSRAYGFVFAQHFPRTDLVRVGIADCGIGILDSFRQSGSPHYSAEMTDLHALRKAVEPKVSSKSHIVEPWGGGPVNAGVGLTLLREITIQVGGTLWLCSGEGIIDLRSQTPLAGGVGFQGTICALCFSRSAIMNFVHVLQQAKMRAGLLSSGRDFSENFK